MDTSQIILQTVVVAIAGGILMQVVAEKAQLPSIVFLLLVGVLLGPFGFSLVDTDSLGSGMQVLVSLAVALILFEGGLSLDLESFKEVDKSVRNMLTVGLAIMIIGTALCVHYIMAIDWQLSLLFGCFMCISGLTVINPILRRVKIKRNLATILRSEGILTNAFGAFLSVGVLELILTTQELNQTGNFDAANHVPLVILLKAFAIKFLVGSSVGYLMGWSLGKALKKRYISGDLTNLVVLAWVFTTYFVSNSIESNTGILAAVITGFAVQKQDLPQLMILKKFKGQLSVLLISILFVLIAADLNIDQFASLGWKGTLIVFLVVFVIRPIAVFASNIGLLDLREKLLVSWIGPKGIVSASVASLFGIILRNNNVEATATVENLVFVTILFTVIAQGLTAKFAAKACNALVKDDYIVIVGANVIGRLIAKVFRDLGKEVCLVDNNHYNCLMAEASQLKVVHGNCLNPSIQEDAQFAKATVLIATTSNSEVNFLVSQMAKDNYQVPYLHPAIGSPEETLSKRLVTQIGGDLAYARPLSIVKWKSAIDEERVCTFEKVMESSGKLSKLKILDYDEKDWLPIILKRKDKMHFAHADQVYSKGDVLVCLSKTEST